MKTKKGGSLPVGQIKEFLDASYNSKPPETIGDYQLDTELSQLYVKVYFSISQRKVVIIHRGTVEASDWGNNLAYSVNSNLYNYTSRYNISKNIQKKTEKKYKGYKIETLGHSQGGLLAHKLGEKSLSRIELNPAYKGETQGKNEYIIRSSFDPVSALKAPKNYMNSYLYPQWNKKHNITIKAKTSNPLVEHSVDILNRLPQNQQIGSNDNSLRGGYIKYQINSDFPYD